VLGTLLLLQRGRFVRRHSGSFLHGVIGRLSSDNCFAFTPDGDIYERSWQNIGTSTEGTDFFILFLEFCTSIRPNVMRRRSHGLTLEMVPVRTVDKNLDLAFSWYLAVLLNYL